MNTELNQTLDLISAKKKKLRINMAPPKVEDSTIGTGDST